MRVRHLLVATLSALCVAAAHPSEVTLPAVQTGGFYADGGKNNDAAFQNYFVGYGTTPGFPRTAERRSFFHFDLSSLAGAGPVASATLHLRLPFGGLIFGKGPGDPMAGPLPTDPTETFALGVVHVPSVVVESPALTAPEAMLLFSMMDDFAIAAPTVFVDGAGLPDPGDGGPPIISITFDGAGLAELMARLGSEIVLSGWMPSWSEDFRIAPGGGLAEGSELIFGLTDVHAVELLRPLLTITFEDAAGAPAPSAAALAALGLTLLALRRRTRR